ncbi:PAS domain-containing protein [Shewanella avicenniae]|uniref:PAS domain-containing protein n=1 Tax=Shewanella avicenniae TaxID=2814294 RepID=A0ABX7QN78_9GAMM|nr:PAS domain-containing protein [Shewanella avicenniae]QSX32912.1 PAS domain-containing protein [Shewanella avicenniae]
MSSKHRLKESPLTPHIRGVQWSRQRLLAVVSQLCMLVITIVLIANVVVTLGERKFQQEWAVQRYSELQTVGTLLADKVSFQQFRTQMFARAEQLRHYLQNPGEQELDKMLTSWDSMKQNIPELMDIALFDASGKFKQASSPRFGAAPLPKTLLQQVNTLSDNNIYISGVEFVPVEDRLEPYQMQIARLENPDQSVRGYLVTYNSLQQMLQAIKPAFSSNDSPLLLLDDQGQLYAGASNLDPLPGIPDTLGSSLRQTYPTLWRELAMNNFGEFQGDNAAFVFLKIQLGAQATAIDGQQYLLMSYIRNDDITARFEEWRNILLISVVIMTILATAVIVLVHLYRIEQRSRANAIELADGLFGSDAGCLLANTMGRIICANDRAAKLFKLAQQDIENRSLQKLFEQDDLWYSKVREHLQHAQIWHGEVQLQSLDNIYIRFNIRLSGDHEYTYVLVTFEDISDLKQAREEAHLNQMLSDSSVATALLRTNGQLVKVNDSFNQLLRLNDCLQQSLLQLLKNDFENQWQRILKLISMHGHWQGQILNGERRGECLQITLKGCLDEEGELEYLICTLEQAGNHWGHKGEHAPYRSTVMNELPDLERYFEAMDKDDKRHSCLLLLDINPEDMLSHFSDIGQLESRQQQVEMQLLRDLPRGYQMSNWQLGRLVILLPNTDPTRTHHYAKSSLDKLSHNGLSDGICMGIAAYSNGQSLEQFLANAEVALKRAKQSGYGSICQAYTAETSAPQ